MKPILTESEKLALNQDLGDSLIVDMSGKTANQVEEENNIRKFNNQVDEYVSKYTEYTNKLTEYSKKVAENIETIEIMPINNYVLVKQFDENPFQRIAKDTSGLITDLGGMRPVFKNTDSGQVEQEEAFILVGVIQEVGPECKWCKPGDTVMYTKPSAVPVPFYRQGLILVNETRVLVTINEGLTKRFEEIKNGRK